MWKGLNQVIESFSIAVRLRTRLWIQFPRPEGQGQFFLGTCHAPRMSVSWEQGLLSPVSRRMSNAWWVLNYWLSHDWSSHKVAWASTVYPILSWCLKCCIKINKTQFKTFLSISKCNCYILHFVNLSLKAWNIFPSHRSRYSHHLWKTSSRYISSIK